MQTNCESVKLSKKKRENNYVKATVNKYVFKERLKESMEVAERTESGRLFQSEGAATQNARPPVEEEHLG